MESSDIVTMVIRFKTIKARCKMKTYGGFFIMAGPAPRGVKPKKCRNVAMANGFCKDHNPEHW